jgi:tripartite-type tricarboxylate transporter receptor subunit TctC
MAIFSRVIAALAVACFAVTAHAQSYPSRLVRIVVPFPAGGATDVMARTIADRLQSALGQSFIVENRGGAGGLIGVSHVAKSAPDGYTLLFTTAPPIAVGLKMYDKLPYDVMRDLTPIATVIANPMVFLSNASIKAPSFNELLADAKANPEKLKMGFGPFGGLAHVVMEQLRLQTGAKITAVPYKGAAPLVADLLAGHIDVALVEIAGNLQYINANRLRPLAVASRKRSAVLPDTPTFTELGLPYMVAESWNALLAPAGTPKEVVGRLNEEVNKILVDPSFKALVAKQAAVTMPGTPENAHQFLQDEIEKWGKIVVGAGIKMEP